MKTFLLPYIFAGFFLAQCAGNQVPLHRLPKPDHIVIVIEENHGYDQIIGSDGAPYINQLADRGALFTNAHGVTHPSQPNYLALYAGSIEGVTDDHCLAGETPYHSKNLGWSLIHSGDNFTGYSETMKTAGDLSCGYGQNKYAGGSPLYARKHNPWVDWQGTGKHNIPPETNQPLRSFPDNFSNLPTVSFVIPNEDHDMHNGKGGEPIKEGDTWLKNHLDSYVKWAKDHNSLLIITYDEDNNTPQNHIPTIFVGPMVKPGKYDMKIDHFNVLRTIEGMYGLEKSGSAKADVITGVWK